MSDSLRSWGRYPQLPQTLHACHWQQEARANLAHLAETFGTTLPYGNGRSYGDSCLAASGQLLSARPLDRVLSADWSTGLVRVEAGLSLGELLELCVPHGWFLPVTPGTKFVTMGGALANDVHGKNHHVRGTFGCHVRSFALLRSDHAAPLVCTPTEHADIFRATVGGLGLTGMVLWVEIQLMAIQSSALEVTSHRFGNLAGFFELSSRLDADNEYAVAWVDCLARGSAAGRGIYFAGKHADTGSLRVHRAPRLRMPFTPPVSAVNHITLSAFNAAYYHLHRGNAQPSRAEYEPFFYPLDGILEWNRMYGREGFQQYQCVVPDSRARDALPALLGAIAQSGRGSFLAVLKRCGDMASPGLLSFPMAGISLALDFAQHEDLNHKLFPRLDAIVRQAGGRLYPAKDAHMSAEDFQVFFPHWHTLESARDPVLMSHFWKRVTLA